MFLFRRKLSDSRGYDPELKMKKKKNQIITWLKTSSLFHSALVYFGGNILTSCELHLLGHHLVVDN